MNFKTLLIGTLICLVLFGCSSSEELQADAGQDFTITMGEQPTFDGCDSTGDIENYKWTIVTPSDKMPDDAGKILRATDENCSFSLEAAMGVDEVGTWVIELEVRDADGATSTDTVQVEVAP